jgi:NADPH:quinone reductase-like Zn-dependent oxidoreductase
MKAIRIHDYGDAGALQYEDAPAPEIGADGLLIKVVGAGVNPVDYKIRAGYMKAVRALTFPAILGSDVSGVVERVGAAISRYKSGDAVVARTDGAYAEYAAAKIDTAAPAPKSIPLTHAAAIPIAAGTAWTVLFESAPLAPGQTVLIQGGSGGVGTFAIQLAKLAGLRVIATTSTRNVSLVRSLGADEVIDYTREDVARQARDVDLVFDTVGGEAQKRLYGVLKKGGLLISIVGPPDESLARDHGITARFERSNVTGPKLAEIAGLIDAGKLTIQIEKEFPLVEARAAHELVESGRARGKVVLRVSG